MRSGRTIHILGAGEWQLPTIRLAKSLGYRVLVTDIYAERPGYALADHHEVMDIADREGTLKIGAQYDIDGIICDTTDVGVPTMAYVAEKLGLPGIGFDTALNFTNKLRMRSLSSSAGLPGPAVRTAADPDSACRAASDLGYPVVIKPVDNQSSRGVHVVREGRELEAAYLDAARHTKAPEVLVEEFISGTEVTVEGLCVDGEAFVVGISDKDHFRHRPEVACRLTYPANFPPGVLNRIREVNAGVVKALGLRTGITHAEYMVRGGEVYLIEIAARGAGSRVYSDIVPYLAGSPIPQYYLEYLTGGAMPVPAPPSERAANLAFFSFSSGTVRKIDGVEEARRIPGVQEILLELKPGDPVRAPQDDRSRPGLVVVFGQTRAEVLDVTEKVFRTVKVEVA